MNPKPPARAYIGLGGNLGNVHQTFLLALERMAAFGTILQRSSTYQTPPWGDLEQPDYLNAVLEFETHCTSFELINLLLELETDLGRVRDRLWMPRNIDLDLLSYNQEVLDSKLLILPHPRLRQRGFVLLPLCEIAPHWQHPTLEQSATELLALVDLSGITRVGKL
jgi:2-amino-4-hydroxy-6-hydroxymethyldihydropteridine diphosphokinase